MSSQRSILSFFNTVARPAFPDSKIKRRVKKENPIDTSVESLDKPKQLVDEIEIVDGEDENIEPSMPEKDNFVKMGSTETRENESIANENLSVNTFDDSKKILIQDSEDEDSCFITAISSVKTLDSSGETIIIDSKEILTELEKNPLTDEILSVQIVDNSEEIITIDSEEIPIKTEENNLTDLTSTFNNSKDTVIVHDELNVSTDNTLNREGVDDVTHFFLDIIKRFLNDENLKNLFDKSEIKVISNLYNMKNDLAKQLFVHVYWLQPAWHRISKIVTKYLGADHCKDFGNNSDNLKYLLDKSLFIKAEKLNIDEYASMLTLPELCEVAKYFKIKTTRKSLIIEELKKCNQTGKLEKYFKSSPRTNTENTIVNKRLSLACQDYIKIKCETRIIFDKLHILMYIGANPALFREKKLNLMLINTKNGKQHYPCFFLDVDSPSFCFPKKSSFEEFFSIYMKTEEIIKLTTKKPCDHQKVINISGDILREYTTSKFETNGILPWNEKFTAQYQCIRGLELSINSFKTLKSYDSLLNILSTLLNQKLHRKHKRAHLYDEKLLILQKRVIKISEFIDVLCQALEDTLLDEDSKAPLVDRAQSFLKRNKTKLDSFYIERLKKIVNAIEDNNNIEYITIKAENVEGNTSGQKAKYKFKDYSTEDTFYLSVENYAIMYYCNNLGFSYGEHWEGRIITSIFSLLFWDIIYSRLPDKKGIFINKYQEIPLDMHSQHFYKNRQTAIDKRLDDINNKWLIQETIEYMTVIRESIKEGTISLYNDNIDFDTIKEVVLCLGSSALYKILRRLATSYHYSSSGFPDITVWNIETKKIKFVEVKGIGDRPSFKQIQWLQYMKDNEIECEICYVENNHSKKLLKIRDARGRVIRERKAKTPKKKPDLLKDDSSDDFTQSETSVNSTPKKRVHSPDPSQPGPSRFVSPKKLLLSPGTSQSAFIKSPVRSPMKSPRSSQNLNSPSKMSPKARKSLSLTRRRLLDVDK